MKIKQSVCFPIMQPLPVEMDVFLETVRGIGFAAVEIWGRDTGFETLARLAQKNGLRIASMVGHSSLAVGLNNPAEHPRIIDELRESIDLAADYEIPGLICFSGNRRSGQSDEEGLEACATGLRQIAPYAEAKGINLNIELLNSRFDHPGYQCDHSSWGFELARKVNSPRVKLLFDIYHMGIMEGNLIQSICENIQWIGHFHTAGVPGRHEIDDTQEINYRGICRALARTPYDLYIGHEFKPTGDLFTSLREAYAICDQG